MECCSTGEGAGGELGPRGEGRSRRDAESMVDAQWIAARPSYVHAVSMRPSTSWKQEFTSGRSIPAPKYWPIV